MHKVTAIRGTFALVAALMLTTVPTVAHTTTDGGQFAPTADITAGRIAYAAPVAP